MIDWFTFAWVGLLSYLWGGVSPARLIGSRLLKGERLDDTRVALPNSEEADVRYRGISATSVGAKLGPKWGITIGIIDLLKASIPMVIAAWVWPESFIILWVGALIMVGHNWPVQHQFHGGRGQSVMLGALLVIDPLSILVCFPLGMAFGLLVLKDMFVAYTLGQFLLIVWFAILGTTPELVFAIAINLIYVVAALPEARDYMKARREGKIGKLKSVSDVLNAHPAMGENRFKDDSDKSS